MAQLTWDAVGARFYEAGVDRGVLYVNGLGHAWPGLISVSEEPTGGEPKPYYLDGIKYLNLSRGEDFGATVSAFYYPKAFAECDGTKEIQQGLFATQQPRKPFDFSYRTRVGNDVDGVDHGYKIHLVYNALAAPSSREHTTIGEDAEPTPYEWALSTLPPRLTGRRPTAHFIVDSRYTAPALMERFEKILYGNEEHDARIPSVVELVSIFESLLMLRANAIEGGYEIYETDDRLVARAFIQSETLETTGEPVLWLDTSSGTHAVPMLVTGD